MVFEGNQEMLRKRFVAVSTRVVAVGSEGRICSCMAWARVGEGSIWRFVCGERRGELVGVELFEVGRWR